jgi:hypothetical protein
MTSSDVSRGLTEIVQNTYYQGRISAATMTRMMGIVEVKAEDSDLFAYRARVAREIDAIVLTINPCRTYSHVVLREVQHVDRELARKLYEPWRQRTVHELRRGRR